MLEENPDNLFPTVVSDGAYIHFLEGFASILFYQERVNPVVDKEGNVDMNKSRETIADIRFSIKSIKKLADEIQMGLKLYSVVALTSKNINFLQDTVEREQDVENTEQLQDMNMSYDDFEMVKGELLRKGFHDLTPEGIEKYNRKVGKILFEHFDELREIIQEYEKPNEAKYSVNRKEFPYEIKYDCKKCKKSIIHKLNRNEIK